MLLNAKGEPRSTGTKPAASAQPPSTSGATIVKPAAGNEKSGAAKKTAAGGAKPAESSGSSKTDGPGIKVNFLLLRFQLALLSNQMYGIERRS